MHLCYLGATLGIFAALSSSCASRAPSGERGNRNRVVIISLDGFRPAFYRANGANGTEPEFQTPTLKSLAARGASAEGAESIYPSVTYPSHTTIVTGALSSEHGIYFNTLFSVEEGSSPLWYWDSKAIRVPTLWQKARAQGRTTAIMTWPVSVGADVDWLVPEIFPADPESSTEKTWDLTRKNMNSDFLAELSANNEEPELAGFEPRDRWIANAANYMSRKYRPDLMLIHLSNVDNVEHNTGKNSPKTRAALAQADAQIAKILEPIDLSRTTVIILGDHGFYDFDKVIDINTLFEKKKWLRVEATPGSVPKCIQGCSTAEPKVTAPWTTQKGFRIASDWKVMAHVTGGQAAVYTRDPRLNQEVVSLLKKNAGKAYRVIEREELDRLHSFPGALCAVDPITRTTNSQGKDAPGYSMGKGLRGPLITHTQRILGNHGPLPTDPQMRAGFIVVGPHVTPGKNLGLISLLDVAPTVSKILGIDFPQGPGRVLSFE